MLAVLMMASLVGAALAAALFGVTQYGWLGSLMAAPAGAGILTLICRAPHCRSRGA